ncbi:response regulator [Ferranicluibacter rubi]|uniref:Response regulator n=1 Tax=Ferranicluibacter rubi TaxID=2715133 RepID=A0AA44CBK1_9HYPH|nr:response regulator [Ferranicluibacter rubi]PYE31464.1 response regulator receiver domain-containing protein [Rhizobium sp. PP-WC-1G-195]TCP82745.1 response regulator receiver domain-containing protein [Rhizobium sp. PP-CC-2G-626]TCQ03791.1 response regulator receiver domain-containing protein [Rhizobium sp. PP-F2F-G36]TCQ20098.1 response regulator receiver domain-containing protein [Rhizobium sp. PP-CC-3G-465]NHT77118.1 response regulator [Ferranicluibacter rubi]
MGQSYDRRRIAVLVVEDEPLLLMDAMDMVEDAGFTVYGAGNADEAIRLMEKHHDICVLFTDVDMPGSMDGLKLAHAVRDRWPPVSIIIASGHVNVAHETLPENGLFFSKPYPPVSVVKALDGIAERIMQ